MLQQNFILDGKSFEMIFLENQGTQTIFEKMFGMNQQKKVEKLKAQGLSNEQILDNMFVGIIDGVDKFVEDNYIPANNAIADVIGWGKFSYTQSSDGSRIDRDSIIADIVHNIVERNTDVLVNRIEVKAEITRDDLIANTVKRGGFRTNFADSPLQRKKNISLATGFLNGYVLVPNATFSFNDVVGERTEERGFQNAIVIVDGKFVNGVGGGVCQVSTTLFNACLLSDIEVKQSMHHSLPVKYVELSRDAMVSEYSDLKFCNTTRYNLYIFARATESFVDIEIYGQKNIFDIKVISEKIEDIPREVQYIDDKTLPKNTEKIVNNGADGVRSCAFIEKYYRGNLVCRYEIRQDTYKPQKKVIARGCAE